MCINEEGISTVLMMKNLRLPQDSGIKNTVLEMLITEATLGPTCMCVNMQVFNVCETERSLSQGPCS